MSEDEQGNLAMVDEPGPSTTNLQGAGLFLGVLTVGVLGAFYDDFRPGVAGAPNVRNTVGNQ